MDVPQQYSDLSGKDAADTVNTTVAPTSGAVVPTSMQMAHHAVIVLCMRGMLGDMRMMAWIGRAGQQQLG